MVHSLHVTVDKQHVVTSHVINSRKIPVLFCVLLCSNTPGTTPYMGPDNDRRSFDVSPSLIGPAQAQNDLCSLGWAAVPPVKDNSFIIIHYISQWAVIGRKPFINQYNSLIESSQ